MISTLTTSFIATLLKTTFIQKIMGAVFEYMLQRNIRRTYSLSIKVVVPYWILLGLGACFSTASQNGTEVISNREVLKRNSTKNVLLKQVLLVYDDDDKTFTQETGEIFTNTERMKLWRSHRWQGIQQIEMMYVRSDVK